jgi:MoxR-like ATPase
MTRDSALLSPEAVETAQARALEIQDGLDRALLGQADLTRMVVVACLARGHVLLEGLPGLGKTELVKALASLLGIDFRRLQFTPDLLPGDVTGGHILEEDPSGGRRMVFHPGPVFTNVLLADEINRASPKTQSALLEAMQERSVTVVGETRKLPRPFYVLATQNPIELEGTYPLPEAQLDRFLLKLLVPPPPPEDLTEILRRTTVGAPITTRPQFTLADVRRWQATVRDLPVPPWLLAQAVALVRASHPDDPTAPDAVRRYVLYGSSPRGGQALIVGAKALACLTGKPLSPAHVAAVAPAALRHRLCLNFTGAAAGITPDVVVEALLSTVASDPLVARRDP